MFATPSLRSLLVLPVVAGLACAPQSPPDEPISLADVGFATPESVLHDRAADVYLVSNINGSPLEMDDNGFIARVNPDGTMGQLKWIDGAAADVTLHAPKGMAIKVDTLFVADIDHVRMFHRVTGAQLGARMIAGATFLNDVAVGPDGTVYVSDSGFRAGAAGFEPSGSDAVYRFGPDGSAVAVAKDTTLGGPNGLSVDATGIVVVTFGSGVAYHLAGGERHPLPALPGGQLDGVERTSDGALLISSWETQSIYRVMGTEVTIAVDSAEAPADIGYDARRNRVLIPLFMANRVEVIPLGGAAGKAR